MDEVVIYIDGLYLRDRARGVLDSAILGLSESLGMSWFEKANSLFVVTECMGDTNNYYT